MTMTASAASGLKVAVFQRALLGIYYIEDVAAQEEVLGFFGPGCTKSGEVPVREHVAETLQSLWNSGHTIHLIAARDESSGT